MTADSRTQSRPDVDLADGSFYAGDSRAAYASGELRQRAREDARDLHSRQASTVAARSHFHIKDKGATVELSLGGRTYLVSGGGAGLEMGL